jgi:hypothetical protein
MSDTFLGIVVGSGFTALGVLLQGLVSWFLDCRRHERTLRLHEMTAQQEKKREIEKIRRDVYCDFIDTYGTLVTSRGMAYVDGNIAQVLSQDLKGLLSSARIAHMMSLLSLYGSTDVANAIHDFMIKQVSSVTTTNTVDFKMIDAELLHIVKMMRTELSEN